MSTEASEELPQKRYVTEDYLPEYRILTQTLIRKRSIPYKTFTNLITQILPNHARTADEVISIISQNLEPYSLRAQKIWGHIENEELCILTPMVNVLDEKNRNHVGATEIENGAFFKLIGQIIYSDEGYLDAEELRQDFEIPGGATLSRDQLGKVVEKLIGNGLIRQDGNKYTLTDLSLVMLEAFIKDKYKEHVKICSLCQRIALQSKTCTCNKVFHPRCLGVFWEGRKRKKCPECSEDYECD